MKKMFTVVIMVLFLGCASASVNFKKTTEKGTEECSASGNSLFFKADDVALSVCHGTAAAKNLAPDPATIEYIKYLLGLIPAR